MGPRRTRRGPGGLMTSDTTIDAEARADDAPSTEPERPRRFRYALPGAWVALVLLCLSFTPSLLPRGPLAQGVICGVNAAIGYGLGVAGAWVWRAFADREPRPASRTSWLVFAAVAVP